MSEKIPNNPENKDILPSAKNITTEERNRLLSSTISDSTKMKNMVSNLKSGKGPESILYKKLHENTSQIPIDKLEGALGKLNQTIPTGAGLKEITKENFSQVIDYLTAVMITSLNIYLTHIDKRSGISQDNTLGINSGDVGYIEKNRQKLGDDFYSSVIDPLVIKNYNGGHEDDSVNYGSLTGAVLNAQMMGWSLALDLLIKRPSVNPKK